MSLGDVLRDGAIEDKKHEIESASRSQSAHLSTLYAVTALLTKNNPLSSLIGCKFDSEDRSWLGPDHAQFLKLNSLGNGRRFDQTSLPIPTIDINRSPTGSPNGEDTTVGQATQSNASQPEVPTSVSTSQARQPTEAPLNDIAPPEAEEEAQFDTTTAELVDQETPKKPAKTVHLPPEKVQEQRLHEVAEAKAHAHDRPTSHAHNELASSPGSTVGAYSAATPMPPQDSPDTSPDSESAAAEIPPEFQLTPQQQKAKDEHDRQLAAQKAVAHAAALGDVNTPDDQLRWEEREAAAREKEEREATTNNLGPEPTLETTTVAQTEAAEVSAELKIDHEVASLHKSSTATTKQHDDENIAVTPRNVRQSTTKGTVSPQDRPGTSHTRRQSSFEGMSPLSIRRRSTTAHDSEVKMSWTTPGSAVKSEVEAVFAILSTLKGAADDPERDYLEPLFKIQAHDSPSIRTSALPDLIKAASKTITTDDQFTSLHERMEYRILRRIYHLQNANKWSLRQMEKAKEPAPPVSHHDHMMAEMKWLCKDFRAERKRKKSVCFWLATRCAEWFAADEETRLQLQVKVMKTDADSRLVESDDVPDLDTSAESPSQHENMPGTPINEETLPMRVMIDPALFNSVTELQRLGALPKALKQVPIWSPEEHDNSAVVTTTVAQVSKFVQGKVLAKLPNQTRKRSRYEYEDEGQDESNKRMHVENDLPPEDPDVAIFHPDNKAIRDRLHSQNAFRPPSEFQMPSIPFYELRNGSQWIVEDDQKLRRLTKEYAFNWSIIADQLMLPSHFKSGMERRTPWECFERWVELEGMPADMRKTIYFKTWYTRLESASQNVDKRYQAQLAQVAAQAQQTGITPQHQPIRRRTVPSRVEKRKNTRYLWTVDAMRKNAKKRELAQYKAAESTRAAAQRKASQQAEPQPSTRPMLTPEQWSQKRYERDLQILEQTRLARMQQIEKQRQAMQAARQGVQGQQAVQQQQPRPPGAIAIPQAPVQGNMQNINNNPQFTAAQRQQFQAAARNGQLSINGQAMPQAQMQANNDMQSQNRQRIAAAQLAASAAQLRNGQYPSQQHQFAMQGGNAASPGAPNSIQQQLANNQALLAAYQAQQQNNSTQLQNGNQQTIPQHQQTPNMPPPPTPATNNQQLSSGHVPAVIAIKNQLRAQYPQLSPEQLQSFATNQLQKHSSQQVRQNAMAAAAGLNNASNGNTNMQAYNQQQYHTNGTPNTNYTADNNTNGMNGTSGSPQHSYAQMMRQRQAAQMRLQQSPNVANASPNINHSSPNMAPASPALQFNNVPMNQGQRPPSRSATPQMQRLGSSNSVPGVAVPGMQSPGSVNVQASPRGMQASMAR